MSAVTVIRSTQPRLLCKRYTKIDGKLKKTAVANVTAGICRTLPATTSRDMVRVLAEVTQSTDLCIVPGVWHAAGAEPFELVTEDALCELLQARKGEVEGGVHRIGQRRVGARLKRGIDPSAWMLIDADNPPGIPAAWAALSLAERLAMMEPLIPGISRCERIELRGSSARVVNGSGIAGQATHAWVRVNRPERIETLRERVRVDMVNRDLSFPSPRYSRAEPDKVIGNEQRTVIDLSVWTTGRIVFNARPNLGAGMGAYTVADPGIVIVNEGAGELDINGVTLPRQDALQDYRERTGIVLTMKAEGGVPRVVNEGQLTMDTEIVVHGTPKPLREWVADIPAGGKLRCEAPFRASESEAAVIRLQSDGTPVVHDVGNGTTYRLAAGGTAAGWPEPTPLPDALPAVPAFDPSLLPEALRGWVSDISDRMQCPPDFPAVGALVSLSSLIGARAAIQPKARDDWRVTPNLWGAIIGRPGVMKSPALGEVLKPLHALEAAEAEAGEVARAQWAIDRKVSELEAERDEKTARKLIGDGKANEARALLAEQEQAAEPVARRFIVNDSSVERLGELLAVNPWGLLAYRDELYGLLRDLDKPQQESARGFYLTGYDGDKPHKFDRIIRGLTHIPRVCLAMLGSIQPSRVQEYVRAAVSGGTGDDGLLQRFGLIVWPDACAEFRNVDRYPDAQAKSRARAVFDRLAALQPESEDTPRLWRFDAAGQEVFTEWRIKHEQMLRGGDLHPALESHLAKYRKLIPALALIFALIDTPGARAVGERELLRAMAWGDYLRAHAERLYAAAAQPETGAARALLAKIQAGRLPAAFTPREVAVKGWATLNTPQAVRVAADALADFDWLRREVTHPSVTGGRPSERYVTNPAALQGGT